MQRWRGVVLMTVVVVATVWLALTNQLILYIHPRYVVFTVIMAAVGLVFVVASAFLREPHDHDEPPTRWQNTLSVTAAALSLAIAVGIIVVPPATLSSATLDQRAMNATGLSEGQGQTVGQAATTSDAAFARFTVLDWSSLLRQSSELSLYEGKPVDVVGFVSADPDDPQNMFYVSRFIITCCAVDAQPVGVPVYSPDWQQTLEIDDWVRVTGGFDANPSEQSTESIALLPDETTVVEQPGEPYLY
ncbi:putative repeat protein (TIGR03943 family) [Conyzicola lurida]|uniref:Putative repeat protein (TIGR03943 family) n=1 Tax=Conyzicola lurida TaxID=1172621 RepID=A0A841AJY6_9MICO|nr:putative repeat protein (TIGR03943 family) [Conyzicola lurida]